MTKELPLHYSCCELKKQFFLLPPSKAHKHKEENLLQVSQSSVLLYTVQLVAHQVLAGGIHFPEPCS